MSKLKTASVLAFERKLDVSDAFFWQTDSQSESAKLTEVAIVEKSVRGTISNRLKKAVANDVAKLDAEVEKANLQKVEDRKSTRLNSSHVAVSHAVFCVKTE